MIVGICYTKNKSDAMAWTEAFSRGVKQVGDEVVHIKSFSDAQNLSKCDVSFQVCEECFNAVFAENVFRGYIKSIQKTNKKPRVILDVGFLKNTSKQGIAQRHMSIGINSVKRAGASFVSDSPPDRWRKLKINKPEWRTSGKHILVLGQTENGIGTKTIRERGSTFLEWSNYILQEIRRYTDRKIIYKPHPSQYSMPYPATNCTLIPLGTKTTVEDYLDDCWCAVSSASNAAADCVINGVPVITNDPMSIVYDISSHNVEEINNPITPDISQWLNDTAYAQWNINEMESGESWSYIKSFL